MKISKRYNKFTMKDIDKFKGLMYDFGINYKVEIINGTPKSTLVYLAEDFDHLPKFVEENQDCVFDNKSNKVQAYNGFFTYFAFNTESGQFENVGIFE